MTRIVIADDHAIVRSGLKQIISETPELTVVGEAASADELLTLLRSRPFDVLVLDLTLGMRGGIDLLKQVKSEFPRLPVLILSMHAEELFAIRARAPSSIAFDTSAYFFRRRSDIACSRRSLPKV